MPVIKADRFKPSCHQIVDHSPISRVLDSRLAIPIWAFRDRGSRQVCDSYRGKLNHSTSEVRIREKCICVRVCTLCMCGNICTCVPVCTCACVGYAYVRVHHSGYVELACAAASKAEKGLERKQVREPPSFFCVGQI